MFRRWRIRKGSEKLKVKGESWGVCPTFHLLLFTRIARGSLINEILEEEYMHHD